MDGDALGALATFLTWIFFLGLFGSAIVIVLITIEDVQVLFEKDTSPHLIEENQHR
jgi:hypothetical protein